MENVETGWVRPVPMDAILRDGLYTLEIRNRMVNWGVPERTLVVLPSSFTPCFPVGWLRWDPNPTSPNADSTVPRAKATRLFAPLLLSLFMLASGCGDAPEAGLPVAADSSMAVPVDTVEAGTVGAADSEAAADTAGAAADTTGRSGRRVGDLTLNQAGDVVQNIGTRVFWAIVLLVLFYLVNKAIVWLLDRLAERSAERRLFYKRLVPLARILVWSFGLYVIIRFVFRVDAQSLLAATAAIGVAVGFAAQDLLKNIFGGLVIISDRPFQVGDKISVAGTYGEVSSIGLRSTRIVTPDDNLVTVPNAQVVDSQVANANAGALDCQVVTDLYLPGWVDERKAKQLAFEAAASSKYVYRNKPIVVIVKDEFKETFLTLIKVKAYVLDTRYEFLLMSDITERCREAFRAHGLLSRDDGLAVLRRGEEPHA